jgi:itaconate CoA-transferase
LRNDPRFKSNTQRVAHRETLHAAIAAVCSALTVGEIVAWLERAQIAYARVNTMQEFWNHPQLDERDRWREVETPAGPLRALLPPANLRDAEPRMEPVPTVGQHTDAILCELGYDDAAIRQLRVDGAI